MAQDKSAPRDWRDIISDSYQEKDPEKIRKLAEELDRALEVRDNARRASAPSPSVQKKSP